MSISLFSSRVYVYNTTTHERVTTHRWPWKCILTQFCVKFNLHINDYHVITDHITIIVKMYIKHKYTPFVTNPVYIQFLIHPSKIEEKQFLVLFFIENYKQYFLLDNVYICIWIVYQESYILGSAHKN
jgi:hypothetical protein